MKLNVQGIEEIELTDPSGLCNCSGCGQTKVPSQTGLPMPATILPNQPSVWPSRPPPMPAIPGAGDVAVPQRLPVYTRHVYEPNDPLYREKWGIGGPMIQQTGDPSDAEKWGRKYRANMSGAEGQGDGNQHTS